MTDPYEEELNRANAGPTTAECLQDLLSQIKDTLQAIHQTLNETREPWPTCPICKGRGTCQQGDHLAFCRVCHGKGVITE